MKRYNNIVGESIFLDKEEDSIDDIINRIERDYGKLSEGLFSTKDEKYYRDKISNLMDILIEKKEEMDIYILQYRKTNKRGYIDRMGILLKSMCKVIYKYTQYAKRLNELIDEEKDEIFGENYMKEIFQFIIEQYGITYQNINRFGFDSREAKQDYMRSFYEDYMVPISYYLKIDIPYDMHN